MAEKPILFSGLMVRAVLDGNNPTVRRVVKPQPILRKPPFHGKPGDFFVAPDLFPTDTEEKLCIVECTAIGNYHYMGQEKFVEAHCPYGKPGDRLWVRETFLLKNAGKSAVYRAAIEQSQGIPEAAGFGAMYGGWKPSIHMPRWASRLTLEITQVRVERVQDISFDDCLAEGVIWTKHWNKVKGADIERYSKEHPKEWTVDESISQSWIDYTRLAFGGLWDSIYSKRGFGWEKNPWVWAISFRKVEAHAH